MGEETMTERVARELALAYASSFAPPLQDNYEKDRSLWLGVARAAVASMRSPDSNVLRAMTNDGDGEISYKAARDAWEEAIDSIVRA